MAAFFQSFRSSSMPKRLLRYALSRLELLDAEALDMENLDFALGRNTVFEFRDVGIKLKKLEKLLQLPAAFKLQRAKVLLLRVTVPMDFYTSPIFVEVDGVNMGLKMDGAENDSKPSYGRTPHAAADAVPNTVGLAQSFLETQPSSERRRLEEALAAETHDLGASISVSDDGSSEDEPAFGTGQALSLPEFMADFLQGIVDRMQIRIKRVKLQLDLDVPADMHSPTPEPVSFQLALEDIEVEGVTAAISTPQTQENDAKSPPPIVPKEGKRHVSLANVRAYLISEANVFSALSRSPSMASPSVAASPVMTRNPPSRQTSSLSHGSFREQPMASLQESFRQHLSHRDESPDPERPLEDSEVALGIPYDFGGTGNDGHEDESPPTPRASICQEPMTYSGERPFLSTVDLTVSYEERQEAEASSTSISDHGPSLLRTARSKSDADADDDELTVTSQELNSAASSTEDLTVSHLYTHEEAESMYMSAFSTADSPASASASRLSSSQQQQATEEPSAAAEAAHIPPSLMPGAWEDESESFNNSRSGSRGAQGVETFLAESQRENISPASSRLAFLSHHAGPAATPETATDEQDDVTTPKGLTRVVKEIMHLKTVSIYIPSQHRHIHVQATSAEPAAAQSSHSLGTSIYPQAPGAFSVHAAPASPPPPQDASEDGNDDTLEVMLSPLSVHFDASLGFLLAMVVDKLLKAVKRESPVVATADAETRQRRQMSQKAPEIRVTAQEISVNYLNQLSGVADTCERHLDPSAFTFDQDEVLLNATLQNLFVSISSANIAVPASPNDEKICDPAKQDAVVTKINLQRLRFGYTDGDIISFDSSRPMATSVKDTFLSNGCDVGIKLVRSAVGIMTTDIETLPLVVQIDLRRLDETFGWFGGLSSFLNMSASSTTCSSGGGGGGKPSSPILKSATPVPATSRRPRGVVHFETPGEQHPGDRRSAAAARNKVNVRIGGALVELVGRDCSVAAETNAIKVVGRDEGIGAACGRIRVSGPYLKNKTRKFTADDDDDPAITTEISGVRLELSPAPKDRDLEKLLELIIPSKVKFDDGKGDDEIMVDTLLRQRRKGSVLRATVETVKVRIRNVVQLSPALPNLGEEIAKLSTVAKYLPEDDRPGLLTLARLQKLCVIVDDVGGKIGRVEGQICDIEVGHITLPSLVAVAIRGVSIRRNDSEDLVGSSAFDSVDQSSPDKSGPVIMARAIGDEMEPTIKMKLRGLRIEYRVTAIMDILGLDLDTTTPQDFEASLATSVANLRDHAHAALFTRQQPTTTAENAGGQGRGVKWDEEEGGEEEKKGMSKEKSNKPMALDIGLHDCLLGLNPLNLTSKMVVALTDARLQTKLSPGEDQTTVTMNVNKASILLTDNAGETESTSAGISGNARRQRRRSSATAASPQVADMCARGFVDICYISSASVAATVKAAHDGGEDRQVEVELRDDLLVLETCADSTQTLIALSNALKPPTPPSKGDKYRTKVVPVQDLLASISAEAFGRPEGEYDFDQDFAGAQEMAGSGSDMEQGSSDHRQHQHLLRIGSPYYGEQSDGEELFDATMLDSTMQGTAEGVLLTGFDPSTQEGQASEHDSSDDLVIHEDFYARDEVGSSHTAKVWNSTKNTYDRAPDALVDGSPLKVSIRDVHVIWNLFDGYDWARTRDVIAKAVEDVEAKAMERQQSRLGAGAGEVYEEEAEDEETIGDFLFNSIYIGVPLNRDPRELTRAINEGLDDNATETDSLTTATTNKTALRYHHQHQSKHGPRRRLRLNRSKHHKITFELRGVNVDIVMFPPPKTAGQETLSSIDARVQALDIFDHVPTSTWKKFVTYDQDQGEREMGTSMVHLELLTVRPIPDLVASEIVMRATVLPLRLHVDQDALDFITRFFEFKDEPASSTSPLGGGGGGGSSSSDIPFIQRAEINDIPVKLDFKPKRVDYAGLRSGHTTEFMNFVVLEESRMVMRHVIVYGVSGFDRLGRTLNDIWMPDVRRNQLPGVVAGLAPVRSLVNIGSGFRDLVEIPLREYRRDGRVIRSISKGAAAFARTTGTELVKLGAKIAVGTQYALQGAEEMLLMEKQQQQHQEAADGSWEDGDGDDEDGLGPDDRKQISLYADQPTGVLQGIRGGYRSLTRDVNLARDAIIAVPGEVMESRTAGGAARAVWRRAPTIIFRPAVGVTKAIGQTLMGATNTIDPQNRRRVGEKYKH